jgi:hypothetical protein
VVDLRPEVRVDLLADDMADSMMVERRCLQFDSRRDATMKKSPYDPLPSEPHLRTLEGACLAAPLEINT